MADLATVVGVFRHSGDAHLAAAHVLDEFALTEDALDVLGSGDSWGLLRVRDGEERWTNGRLRGLHAAAFPGEDPAARRWAGAAMYEGKTLVLARTHDEEMAAEIAAALRRTGAEPVDLIPH